MNDEFIESGLESGFTESQLEFMWVFLAKYPHTHSMDEIDGLEEALEEVEEEEEE